MESQSDRDKFQGLVPLMLNTIAHVLNAGEETAAQEALEMFIEVQAVWHVVNNATRKHRLM